MGRIHIRIGSASKYWVMVVHFDPRYMHIMEWDMKVWEWDYGWVAGGNWVKQYFSYCAQMINSYVLSCSPQAKVFGYLPKSFQE